MDAHSTDSIRAAVDAVAARFGGLDLLVNCVGIQREERLAEVSEAAFDEVVQVNLKAAMFMSQAAARHQVAAVAAGRARGPAGAPALGARAARHARPRLLRLLRDQGRARDADQAARGRAVGARHHRQRRRADRRARRDGRALARRPGDARAAARAHPARPRRRAARTSSARCSSSAARRRRSSPARCSTSTAASPPPNDARVVRTTFVNP